MKKQARPINLALIGCGLYAQAIHLPAIKEFCNSGHEVNLPVIVDFRENKRQILKSLKKAKLDLSKPEFIFVKKRKPLEKFVLEKSLKAKLNVAKVKYGINAAIICTDPISRKTYITWALENRLNIFVEKPLSARINSSIDSKQASGNLLDYVRIREKADKTTDPETGKPIVFMLDLHRRFNKAYLDAIKTFKKIAAKTNCPITSLDIYVNDGQWRLPHEYNRFMTHGLNEGIGKLTFTGFHYMDLVPWLVGKVQKKGLEINNAQIQATVVRPYDSARTIDDKTASKIFRKSTPHLNNFDFEKIKKYGDVDIYLTITFFHDDVKVTVANLSLLQSGQSFRHWIKRTDDPQIKKGRLKQKSLIVTQGPFCTFQYRRWRVSREKRRNEYALGGEKHNEIIYFFNPLVKDMFGGLVLRKTYKQLKTKTGIFYSKFNPINEFFSLLTGKKHIDSNCPTIDNVMPGVQLLAWSYVSAARELKGLDNRVRFKFKL